MYRPIIIVLFVCINICAQIKFISNGQSISTTYADYVSLIDIDNDGVLEAYFDSALWENDGNGNFSRISLSFIGDRIFWADFNNDGLLDYAGDNKIYRNNGNKNFTLTQSISGMDNMYYAHTADVDGDGDINIITTSITETKSEDRLLVNDGSGNFSISNISFGGWAQSRYDVGDLNGDGKYDVFVIIPHTYPGMNDNVDDKIWFGNSNGSFTQKTFPSPKYQSRDVAFEDIDNDGDLDIILCKGYYISGGATYSKMYVNDGAGNFTDSNQRLNAGYNSSDICLADFNGDGFKDIFYTNGMPSDNGQPNRIYLNDGRGNFSTDNTLKLGSSNSMYAAAGDINNDGKQDLVVINFKMNSSYQPIPAPVEIWINKSYICNYLNEPKPGKAPLLFGTGVVSVNDENTHALCFSPDGNTLIFSRYPEAKSYIMNFKNGQWSEPAEAFFNGKEVSFSTNGDTIFYYSYGDEIYYNVKTQNGWSNAVNIGSPINTSETEYYPSYVNGGTLFFSRNGKWNEGQMMYSTYSNGKFNTPVNIGLPVNHGGAMHGFVSPDKKYMIFNSPRPGSFTQLDLWISFHNNNDTWTELKNLGSNINSGGDAILCPKVTPDGKYLFFTRLNFNTNTGNVYWISTDFIDSIKQTISSTEKKIESHLKDFNLFQNYPNPFNPSTIISYQLSASSNVKLKIYDTLGREIKTLVNSFQSLGEHSVVWNATDDRNNPVSSGIYFYSLQINETTLQKKMALVQ